MIQLKTGTTRRVVLIGRMAIKLPRHRRGIACNQYELELFRRTTPYRKRMLCPILWAAPWGLALVMRRAVPLTKSEFKEIFDRTMRWDGIYEPGPALPDWGSGDPPDGADSPFEAKAEDWGWLEGRLVALDYSIAVAAKDMPSRTGKFEEE